jgi:hypothetical protein
MTIKQAAVKWGMTPSRISQLLAVGRILGAFKGSKTVWTIPDDTPRPEGLKRGPKSV